MNRHDKLDWLKETCSENHVNEQVLTELVSWMSEDEFDEFYEFHCSNWNIMQPGEMYA